MNKPGFSWLTPVLCVNDLPKSLEHYEHVLGFDVSWKWSEHGEFNEADHPTFACVCRGESSIFLCENGQGSPGAWVCLNVCSLDELHQVFIEYKNASANIVEEPQDYSWGMREMLVKDLDGNTFRIGCQLQ
ncbi:MAG: VOC family protein [Gammaproteobacteria bacterium]|nr:VOC family protein [Gammaproteobacteria bacterium]